MASAKKVVKLYGASFDIPGTILLDFILTIVRKRKLRKTSCIFRGKPHALDILKQIPRCLEYGECNCSYQSFLVSTIIVIRIAAIHGAMSKYNHPRMFCSVFWLICFLSIKHKKMIFAAYIKCYALDFFTRFLQFIIISTLYELCNFCDTCIAERHCHFNLDHCSCKGKSKVNCMKLFLT